MKLTKKDINQVAKEYGLGSIRSVKFLEQGWVNHNYDIKTMNGRYVVQSMTDKMNAWKRDKMQLQFDVIKYLRKKQFPYQLPIPILSSSGKEISRINRRPLWVYPRIEGEVPKKATIGQFRELAKALAIFHQYTKDFKGPIKDEKEDYTWLMNQFEKMSRIRPKDKTDKLMLDNLPWFIETLKTTKDVYSGKQTLLHGDLSQDNAIFEGDKLIGIIDLDDIEMRPKVVDLALAIKRTDMAVKIPFKKKIQTYVSTYRKYGSFPKSEEKRIIPIIMRDNCGVFWWLYTEMSKKPKERYGALKYVVDDNKMLENLR